MVDRAPFAVAAGTHDVGSRYYGPRIFDAATTAGAFARLSASLLFAEVRTPGRMRSLVAPRCFFRVGLTP